MHLLHLTIDIACLGGFLAVELVAKRPKIDAFLCRFVAERRWLSLRHAKFHAFRVRLTHFHLTHALPPAKYSHAFFCEVSYA